MSDIKFGTDGWRAIVGKDFNEENVKIVSRAIGKYVFDNYGIYKTIIVGYDPRNMAKEFSTQCANTLVDMGFKVLYSDKVVPTPVLAYNAKRLDACAVMFTASHNPPEYLGIKFIPDYAGPATSEITDEIVSNFGCEYTKAVEGKFIVTDFSQSYFKRIEEIVDFEKIKEGANKFHILFDGLYSASIGYFDKLLSRNGVEYDAIHMYHDSNFGGGMPDGEMPSDMGAAQSIEDVDNITRNSTKSGISLSGTYETAQDYIDALNADGEWVTYDADTNTATISSVADFVKAFKSASKNLGAFDQLDAGQGENTLFGYGDGSGSHFDNTLAQILSDLGSEYAESYAADLAKTDSAGYTAEQRLQMYTPLYYLLESSEGYGTSTVAKYWRIRTGIAQSDTAVTTEMNLALALENYDSVESVDFETIWGAGHTEAERTGNSTENFITWVNECMK